MNSFGRNFRITSFGESHGAAVGVIIDGCPAGMKLTVQDIQPMLDRRRPGTSPLTSSRDEMDRVEILSGIFEGKTTGAPIAVMVRNEHQKPEDYDFKNTVLYPKARFTFIMDFINDRQTIGFIPACETAEQELGLLNLKPHISVSIPDNAVSLVKSITLYRK